MTSTQPGTLAPDGRPAASAQLTGSLHGSITARATQVVAARLNTSLAGVPTMPPAAAASRCSGAVNAHTPSGASRPGAAAPNPPSRAWPASMTIVAGLTAA